MAMSDCIKCWETPCVCGHHYKDYSIDVLAEITKNILNYKNKEDSLAILKLSISRIEADKDKK